MQLEEITNTALSRFLKYCDLDLDSLLKLPQQELSNLIIKYMVSHEKKISSKYKEVIMATIKHACEMNDVILNWKKLKKFIRWEKTDNETNGKDRGYTHEEIQKILEFSDQRLKTAFLVLASTGIRVGALQSIRIGDLEKIDNYNLYKIIVYSGDKEEYMTFCTPECAKEIDSYLEFRTRRGETITQDSYLLVRKFSSKTEVKGKPFRGRALWAMLEQCISNSGLRTVDHVNPFKRKQIPIFHGFRKFFTKQVVDSNINPEIREMLLGHKIGLASCYYIPTEQDMLNEYYKSVFIIAGTREFANEIKERMERLFEKNNFLGVIHDSKYTECHINNTWFKVFPTKRLKDVRGYIDVSYLFIDEADYFDKKEQDELKYVIKSYEEKSKGKIILVSTAGESGGLFETIENDPNSDFKKLFMLVNRGRGKIFDDKFLDEQKEKDPAFFSRESEGRYGFGLGNVFLYEDIEKCCSLWKEVKINHNCVISCGIDPGFGSSKFAITILQLEDNILRVMYAREWEKASYEQMLFEVSRLKTVYRHLLEQHYTIMNTFAASAPHTVPINRTIERRSTVFIRKIILPTQGFGLYEVGGKNPNIIRV